MKQSVKTGLTFGITSGIITTLGLLVGLSMGSNMKSVVVGGILTIAIADAFSDALGIFISEESDKSNKMKDVWMAGLATFAAKFLVALTFVISFLIFSVSTAALVSTFWGLLGLGFLSAQIAKIQKAKPGRFIVEHVVVGIVVVIITYFIGIWIANFFGA